MQKVTFSLCFLRCSGILNVCANYVHTDSGKHQKSQGKLFFPFNSVNASLKYQHELNKNYEQQKFVFYVFVI